MTVPLADPQRHQDHQGRRVSRRRLLTGVSSVGLGALVTACAGKSPVTTSTGETVALQAVTDADLTAVLATESYAQRTGRDTFNDGDSIYQPSMLLKVTKARDGYVGCIVLNADPDHDAV